MIQDDLPPEFPFPNWKALDDYFAARNDWKLRSRPYSVHKDVIIEQKPDGLAIRVLKFPPLIFGSCGINWNAPSEFYPSDAPDGINISYLVTTIFPAAAGHGGVNTDSGLEVYITLFGDKTYADGCPKSNDMRPPDYRFPVPSGQTRKSTDTIDLSIPGPYTLNFTGGNPGWIVGQRLTFRVKDPPFLTFGEATGVITAISASSVTIDDSGGSGSSGPVSPWTIEAAETQSVNVPLAGFNPPAPAVLWCPANNVATVCALFRCRDGTRIANCSVAPTPCSTGIGCSAAFTISGGTYLTLSNYPYAGGTLVGSPYSGTAPQVFQNITPEVEPEYDETTSISVTNSGPDCLRLQYFQTGDDTVLLTRFILSGGSLTVTATVRWGIKFSDDTLRADHGHYLFFSLACVPQDYCAFLGLYFDTGAIIYDVNAPIPGADHIDIDINGTPDSTTAWPGTGTIALIGSYGSGDTIGFVVKDNTDTPIASCSAIVPA